MGEHTVTNGTYFMADSKGNFVEVDPNSLSGIACDIPVSISASDNSYITTISDSGLIDTISRVISGAGAGESDTTAACASTVLETIRPPREMDANTYLYDDGIGHLCVASYKNGKYRGRVVILPSVTDVKVVNNRVVIVTFADGTEEKAVTHKNDTFNLEQGISVCIIKKFLSKYSSDNTTAVYNKVIKHCVKVGKRNRAAEAKEKAEAAAEKARATRRYEKATARKKKRAEAKRKQNIADMTQAFVDAAKIIDGQTTVGNPLEDDLK